MAQLLEWFTVNRLSLNLDKTCYSIFGPRQKDVSGLNLCIWSTYWHVRAVNGTYYTRQVTLGTEYVHNVTTFVSCGRKFHSLRLAITSVTLCTVRQTVALLTAKVSPTTSWCVPVA